MTTYFVSRHPGARIWAEQQGLGDVVLVSHLEPEHLAPGDRVLGTLPVQLIAAANARGARYFHLVLDIPSERRGEELTPDAMRDFGARLEEYRAEKIG